MKIETLARKLLFVLASIIAVAHPARALAEDIDIFVAGEGGSATANVLIVLDNTSNWASANQKWPKPDMQGQAELKAIAKIVDSLDDSISVGLMLFTQNGSGACCNGGYVRYAFRPMTKDNRDSFKTLLNDLIVNFDDPNNKAASSATPAMAMFDAFKYFGGYTSPAHANDNVAGTPVGPKHFNVPVFASPPSAYPASKADPAGYAPGSNLMTYNPPSASLDACGGRNFLIYIGNGWEGSDTLPQQDMKAFLEGVGGETKQLELPVLTTVTNTTTTDLATRSACAYKNSAKGLSDCNAASTGSCGADYDTCSCKAGTAAACGGGNFNYQLVGGITTTTVTENTGTPRQPPTKTTIRYADEWTRFLQQTDVSAAPGQQNVTTYTIDVFNAQQSADQTALLYSMAEAGGGEYFPAKSQAQIEAALGSIFAQIRADNSTFASASLPVSATNRALNANEVYMGIFRPDADRKPMWYGNLKRYKIANFTGSYKLADVNGLSAVDAVNTGFIVECAISWWTNDSGKYWAGINEYPSPKGGCPPTNTSLDPFSDAPDGPKVEKGGVAEILRQGNVASGSPTWALNRTTRTKAFVPFNTTNAAGMAAADVDFVNGLNIDALGGSVSYSFVDPSGTTRTTSVRSTVHGGVVHSRPLPVNYGGSTGTVLYYGSDDGMYRAVNAATGQERWAYVPEEFYPTLPRLRQNSPKIKYSFMGSIPDPTPPKPKDYHFDGSTGLWQNADNSQVWIFPTMRRGGRMIYAFDVTNPGSPSLKWKKGCTSLTDNSTCDAGFEGIGQTWSTPNVAPLNVDGTVKPALIVGGGYADCEDGAPAPAPAACLPVPGGGAVIYVLDANDGSILRSFTTDGRAASDVALIDIDYDGNADYAYAGDTRGNLYRIAFGPSKTAPLTKANWTSTLIAQTSGDNDRRKFLNAPALLQGHDKSTNKTFVYVALGSGDREQPLLSQYPYADDVKNRFYVFMDDVTASSTADLDDASAMNDATSDPGCGNKLVIPGSNKKGWFMEFPAANRGEQTVTSAVIVGGLVAFSTNAAYEKKDDSNVCKPKGIARGYVVNLFNASGAIAANNNACGGSRSSEFAGGGLPPSPVVANVEVDGKVQTIVIGVADLDGGASSPIQSEVGFTLKPQKRTRMYWRQEGNN